MKKLGTNIEALGGTWAFLLLLFAMMMFLGALVLMGIILFAVSIGLGMVLLVGMLMLWFGPSGWRPFIMMGMIVILSLMVVLLALR